METTDIIINLALREDKKFVANHYNFQIAPEKQEVLKKIKSLDLRIFSAIKKLIETSGNFYQQKDKTYRDLRYTNPTVVIVKQNPIKIKSKTLKELYPNTTINIVILNTSDEQNTLKNDIYLYYGENAYQYLFDNKATVYKSKLKELTTAYIKELTNELLITFSV